MIAKTFNISVFISEELIFANRCLNNKKRLSCTMIAALTSCVFFLRGRICNRKNLSIIIFMSVLGKLSDISSHFKS